MEKKEIEITDGKIFKKALEVANGSIQPSEEMLEALVEEIQSNIVEIATRFFKESEQLELINNELRKKGYTETFEDLVKSNDPRLYNIIMDFLRAISFDNAPDQEATSKLKAGGKKASMVTYPLDKVNSKVWGLFDLESGNLDNVPMRAEKKGSDEKISIYYAINFDELGNDISITRKLQPYDKRAYVAMAALFNAGNKVVTLSQIYHAMGFTGTPGKPDKDKISNSITKMRSAQIRIDNTEELEIGHYKYPKVTYEGALLPSEQVTAIINGQEVDSAIHLFREPPLITFAKGRNQIKELDIKILQSPISKTDVNLQIEGYLIERIARAENGTGIPRILYKKILEQLFPQDATSANIRQIKNRLPSKVKKYLDYYVKCNYIKKYTADKEGVTVYFSKKL